jgi:hypothetical protein
MNRNILLIALALLLSCVPVFAQAPAAAQTPEQGRLDAGMDIKAGKFIIKAWLAKLSNQWRSFKRRCLSRDIGEEIQNSLRVGGRLPYR